MLIISFFVPPLFTKAAKDDNSHVLHFVTCLDGCEQSFEDRGVYEMDMFSRYELFPIVLSHQ